MRGVACNGAKATASLINAAHPPYSHYSLLTCPERLVTSPRVCQPPSICQPVASWLRVALRRSEARTSCAANSALVFGRRALLHQMEGLRRAEAEGERAAVYPFGIVGAAVAPGQDRVERSARKRGNQQGFSRSARRWHWLGASPYKQVQAAEERLRQAEQTSPSSVAPPEYANRAECATQPPEYAKQKGHCQRGGSGQPSG